MYSLEFNEADLNANRQGYLSDAQRIQLDSDVAMLQKNGKYMVWFFGGMVIFMTVLGGFIEFNNAGQDLDKMFSPSNRIGFAIAGTMFTVILLVVVGWNGVSTRRFQQGTVRSVEGKAHVVNKTVRARGMDIPVRNLELKRGLFSKFIFRFQDDSSLRYFKEGQRYRVYYLAYAIPQALSAEELSDHQ